MNSFNFYLKVNLILEMNKKNEQSKKSPKKQNQNSLGIKKLDGKIPDVKGDKAKGCCD